MASPYKRKDKLSLGRLPLSLVGREVALRVAALGEEGVYLAAVGVEPQAESARIEALARALEKAHNTAMVRDAQRRAALVDQRDARANAVTWLRHVGTAARLGLHLGIDGSDRVLQTVDARGLGVLGVDRLRGRLFDVVHMLERDADRIVLPGVDLPAGHALLDALTAAMDEADKRAQARADASQAADALAVTLRDTIRALQAAWTLAALGAPHGLPELRMLESDYTPAGTRRRRRERLAAKEAAAQQDAEPTEG